ncbi:hypothetical protein TanjilG_18277 [Lupinus angustifolius]|uniref:Uncharacterized protein n=1 Tax=Lupinus angustifolius TaxID=3871 RepID=A0A1J7HU67_LUPAN|nr:PREDICTED: auxin-responsive protein SAUR23-like [Lupinus angustifolius]OIW09970.1 hypothetical protein TanjilG_18277 [Lupinus angustifolius]
MAGAMKKVDKIRQMAYLKDFLIRWKRISLRRRTLNDAVSSPRAPSGSLFVYVGTERKRFVIPTRFLNLPIFACLLKETEEEFGFTCNGGLVLPCEVGFFNDVVKCLRKDEKKYGKFSVQDFVSMNSDAGFDYCKEKMMPFTPLLQNTRGLTIL